MAVNRVHFQGFGPPVYPADVVTACGINGYRESGSDEFSDVDGRRYEFTDAKRRVTCKRCQNTTEFKMNANI